MASRNDEAWDKLLHDFRNWLYLLNSEMASVVAKGRAQDPAVHAPMQVSAPEAVEAFLRLHARFASRREELLAYAAELPASHFCFSTLNWQKERKRAEG